MKGRVILLVIDGMGIGAMSDSVDKSANTLRSILNYNNDFHVINKLLLGQINNLYTKNIKYKRLNLGYVGADSLLGHMEMIGVEPVKKTTYICDFKKKIYEKFESKNNICDYGDFISLNGNKIIISNNIEGELGVGINVLGDLDKIRYEEVLKIGKLVSKISTAPRVLAMAANTIRQFELEKCIEERMSFDNDIVRGIVISKTGIYKRNYMVQNIINLGEKQENLINGFLKQGYEVSLIGKTADFFSTEYTHNFPEIDTNKIINRIEKTMNVQKNGFIYANIQEIDLAGHAQDVQKAYQILKIIDNEIIKIISCMNPKDIFIISADHGNDPNIGHSYHTREQVPLVMIGENLYDIKNERAYLNEIFNIISKNYIIK